MPRRGHALRVQAYITEGTSARGCGHSIKVLIKSPAWAAGWAGTICRHQEMHYFRYLVKGTTDAGGKSARRVGWPSSLAIRRVANSTTSPGVEK